MTRRVTAAAALLLWVLGFELVPGLHMARHAGLAPHTHTYGADAASVASAGESPRRAKVRVVASGRAPTRLSLTPHRHAPRPHAPAPAPVDPRHGEGSLAHRGVATLAAAVFVYVPPLAPTVPLPAPAAAVAPRVSLVVLAASARAPPVVSV